MIRSISKLLFFILKRHHFERFRSFIYSILINFGISHSKDSIDKKLIKRLKLENSKGFFIEVGAVDGITYSNSHLFEKQLGWNGLLVEPIYSEYKKCLSYRSAIVENFLLTDEKNCDKEIKMIKAGPLSLIHEQNINIAENFHEKMKRMKKKKYIDGEETVRSTTISHLLKKHSIKNVDIFFIDVEGSEKLVISGMDDEVNFSNVLCETETPEEILKLLERHGFRRYERIARNDYLFTK